MEDSRFRKPACSQSEGTCPRERALVSAAKRMSPMPKNPLPEYAETVEVSRYRIVVEVAPHNRLEPLAGLTHGIVHTRTELLLDLPQLRPHAFADRLAPYREPPPPVLPADVREAQKVERLGLAFSSTFPVLFGESAELDPSRFIWVEFQSKLSQSLPKIFQKAIGVGLMLESYDDVVRVADDHHLALRILLAPDVHPEIESVVQVDIRQHRRNHRALRSACLRFRPFAFLHHPRVEPFLDQPQEAGIGYAMLHELDQPTFVEVIEKSSNVGIKDVVHFLLQERVRQRIQR